MRLALECRIVQTRRAVGHAHRSQTDRRLGMRVPDANTAEQVDLLLQRQFGKHLVDVVLACRVERLLCYGRRNATEKRGKKYKGRRKATAKPIHEISGYALLKNRG